jgi:hypothetical protein
MIIQKVDATNVFDDGNDGYEFGIELYEREDDAFPYEVLWYTSEDEREEVINEIILEEKNVKVRG